MNIWTCHDASPEGNGVFYVGKTPCKHRQGLLQDHYVTTCVDYSPDTAVFSQNSAD